MAEEKKQTETAEEKKTTGKKGKQTTGKKGKQTETAEEKKTTGKKQRKKYSTLTKTEIGELIERKMNCEKVNITKDYKQSKQTEIKINSLLNKSWRKTTEKDDIPNGYFNPNSVEKKIIAVMWDMGYALNP